MRKVFVFTCGLLLLACSDDSESGANVPPSDDEVQVDTGSEVVVVPDEGKTIKEEIGQPCIDICPDGLYCKKTSAKDSDEVYQCVPLHDELCRPCNTDSDCNQDEFDDRVCLHYSNDGWFCGGPCIEGQLECPFGYACDEGQCRLVDGICECTDQAVLDGAETYCVVEVDGQECPGSRKCTVNGMSDCEPRHNGECENPICQDGEWVCPSGCGDGCDDDNQCTTDSCVNEQCVFEAANGPCDDGDGCTDNDLCTDTVCAGAPTLCDDGVECTSDACTNNLCEYKPNDALCDDGVECSVDGCTMGGCQNTPDDAFCSDEVECTSDVCDLEKGCLNPTDGGCDDGSPCTVDSCVDKGCIHEPIQGQCDDGDLCTVGESCDDDGKCSGGTALKCEEDEVACTVVACDSNTGCIQVPDPESCVTPESGGPCTGDPVCDLEKGCIITPLKDGDPCDDDELACAGSECQSGACVPVAGCDDGLSCTMDSCTEGGCVSEQIKDTCFVDGVCFAAGEGSAANSCKICDPTTGTDSLVVAANGSECALDPCSEETVCKDGQCDGAEECPEIKINQSDQKKQENPSISALNDGRMVVVWQSDYQDGDGLGIFGQRHGKDGIQDLPAMAINQDTLHHQRDPVVAALSGGGAVVVWRHDKGDKHGPSIRGRLLSAGLNEPLGDEFKVNQIEQGYQMAPDVAALPGGNFVVVWENYKSGQTHDIQGRIYGPNGKPLADQFPVNSFEPSSQQAPVVAALPNDAFISVWQSSWADGSGWGVYGQRFNPDSSKEGTEFGVNTTFSQDQNQPALATVAGTQQGVVVWRSYHSSKKPLIMGQRLGNLGLKKGDELQVSSNKDGIARSPAVAVDASGVYVVTWAEIGKPGDKSDIYVRSYDGKSNPLSDAEKLNLLEGKTEQTNPDVAMLPGLRPVVVFQTYVAGGTEWDIYLRVLPPIELGD